MTAGARFGVRAPAPFENGAGYREQAARVASSCAFRAPFENGAGYREQAEPRHVPPAAVPRRPSRTVPGHPDFMTR